MALIVEMIHRKEDCPEPRFYSCDCDTWKQLLTLAETFGWQPSGSVNANDIDRPTVDCDKHFKTTYDPDEWAYCKAVSKEDAKKILQSLFSKPMMQSSQANSRNFQKRNRPYLKILYLRKSFNQSITALVNRFFNLDCLHPRLGFYSHGMTDMEINKITARWLSIENKNFN